MTTVSLPWEDYSSGSPISSWPHTTVLDGGGGISADIQEDIPGGTTLRVQVDVSLPDGTSGAILGAYVNGYIYSVELDAGDHSLDFTITYGSGYQGRTFYLDFDQDTGGATEATYSEPIVTYGGDEPSGDWANIFDLDDWDIYIRYVGITNFPDPDSRSGMVPIDVLDPSVGTVTVTEEGKIVCDLESASGEGGAQPVIVLMPRNGTLPENSSLRVSCEKDGDPFIVGGGDYQVTFFTVNEVLDNGDNTYNYDIGTVYDELGSGTNVTNVVLSGTVPDNEGIGFNIFIRPS